MIRRSFVTQMFSGFRIAVDDSRLVRGRQCTGQLYTVVQHFPQAQRAFANAIAQSVSLQSLSDDERRSVVLADVKDRNNIGMIQGGSGLGFLLKASRTFEIARPILWKHLDGYVAFECSVAGSIDLAHSARTQGPDNLIGIEAGARGEWHRWSGLYPDSLVLELVAVDLRLEPSGAGHEQIGIVPGLKSASWKSLGFVVGMSDT